MRPRRTRHFSASKTRQRETGEVLVEGAGTMELTATEGGGLKRMDMKEINPYLRSLARFPLQVAFRYHRQPNEAPSLALAWVRFPDSAVLAAVAERAVITTLVTTEGQVTHRGKADRQKPGAAVFESGSASARKLAQAFLRRKSLERKASNQCKRRRQIHFKNGCAWF